MDLPAHERAEAGGDVAAEASRSHDETEDLSLRLDDPMPGNRWRGGADHPGTLLALERAARLASLTNYAGCAADRW